MPRDTIVDPETAAEEELRSSPPPGPPEQPATSSRAAAAMAASSFEVRMAALQSSLRAVQKAADFVGCVRFDRDEARRTHAPSRDLRSTGGKRDPPGGK